MAYHSDKFDFHTTGLLPETQNCGLCMPGMFSPPPGVSDPDMQHGTLSNGFPWSRWRGKRSRHSRRMRNPQFYVSDKRPMVLKLRIQVIHVVPYTRFMYTPSLVVQTSSWLSFLYAVDDLGPFLLAWINFNTNMDKKLHQLWIVGWNYLSISNFNGCTVRVLEGISKFTPHFIMDVMTYPFWV